MAIKVEGEARAVVGGVDTHKDLHVAAVVDEQDRVLPTQSFATTRQGYRQMLAWMRSFGHSLRALRISADYGFDGRPPPPDTAGVTRVYPGQFGHEPKTAHEITPNLDKKSRFANLDRSKSKFAVLSIESQRHSEIDPEGFIGKVSARMRARVTLKDIAQSAGVSRATVSLVLRNNPLVAQATRERVRSSIESLGYVYDRAAANLRTRYTYTVGLVVCEITNPFYAELTAGIDETLDRAGWVGFLANTAESPARQDRFIERMREHRVDGLLLCPAEGTNVELVDRLHRFGLPVVQILRRLGRGNNDHVGADFRLGMTLAAEHLIRLGHRRIAFVGGGRRASPGRDRARAYRETLDRYGLPIGPIINCLPTREEGKQAVGRLIRGGRDDPTAVICHNDLCALGVLVGLSDRGLVAGSDRAVIGFDNIPEAAHSRPALTTIDIRARRIGEEAANLLLRRVKDPAGAPESIVLPPRLIIRSSCGGQVAHNQSTIPP